MFTSLEIERIHSFANFNYKVITDQGLFVAKIPKPFADWQTPINPPEHSALTDQIISDNQFGARMFYKDESCKIYDYLDTDHVSLEESLQQENRILFIIPLAKF